MITGILYMLGLLKDMKQFLAAFYTEAFLTIILGMMLYNNAHASLAPYTKAVSKPTQKQCIVDMKKLGKSEEKAKKICAALLKIAEEDEKKKKKQGETNEILQTPPSGNGFDPFNVPTRRLFLDFNQHKTIPQRLETHKNYAVLKKVNGVRD